MGKFKNILKHPRIIILLMCIVLALYVLRPNPWHEGAAIRSVAKNSTASIAGIENPKPDLPPMDREVILSVNNKPVKNADDYYNIIRSIGPNMTVQIKTTKRTYRMETREAFRTYYANGTEVRESIGVEDLGIVVYDAPTNNIRKGLDLQGGTRVVLQPEKRLSTDDMDIVLSNIKERLNVYGLSDIVVREANDMSGNQFIIVEIAGATEEEVRNLIASQGKFEAKIGNDTVFRGEGDITYVCKNNAQCSGIDPNVGCGRNEKGYVCRFRFSISLRPEAAQRQAELTKDLDIVTENKEKYLSKKLDLYLDDVLVDTLNIGADLKGKAETKIDISGPGVGITEKEAFYDALNNMKRLQTILLTGSLPVKINVVKMDSLSPIFGKDLIKNSLLIGLVALVAVSLCIFARYKRIELVVPIIMTSLLELLFMMGIAAAWGWNIDLAAIAGIIISIGTGVNDQIIITDETLKGRRSSQVLSWKERIKNAFLIIFGAYFTLVVAMLPLCFAGGGLLRGFAITSITGLTVGVLITRPAYAAFIEEILKEGG